LPHADLARVLALRGDRSAVAEELLAAYPPPLGGCHRLPLAGGRVQLSLWFGDAVQQFAAARAAALPGFETAATRGVDAWFLDGFAPARNPQMWSPALFAQIAALSRPGATFATFTAAGAVRRGLTAAGFAVARVPGYGRKREMLRGRFAARPAETAAPLPTGTRGRRTRGETPWDLGAPLREPLGASVSVVGAGIAGCTTARALAERGWQVRVLDGEGVAAGASGNPQGIVFPRLAAVDSPFARINLAALLYARRYYRPHWRAGLGADRGVLLLPRDAREAEQLRRLAARFPGGIAELDEAAGLALDTNCGLLLAGLGWLPPAQVCGRLLDHPRIEFERRAIADLAPVPGGWQLAAADGSPVGESTVVVLATGTGLSAFAATDHLPLRVIRGQITSCPATAASRGLRLPVCGIGYLAPALDGRHCLGATYQLGATSMAVECRDHQRNLQNIRAMDPALAEVLGDPAAETLAGRAGLRAVTPDYLPVVGPAPIAGDFPAIFAPLRRDARAALPRCGRYWPGLYLHGGLGSRGLAYAPLCAALLADLIAGHPRPLPRDLVRALSPARFLVRDLQRQR
jgi:tRNA 5-methylaminomethyl-2-thiouridine biosynthesis bifunctional protein